VRHSLLWKLLAINVPVIAAVIAVMWLTIDYLAADYFAELMTRYNISPAETHQMFLDAVHRYLIQATVVAVAVAGLLAFWFTRMALRPLSEMAAATRELAAGDYRVRVAVGADDEVGRLGRAFNDMADSLERLERQRRSTVSDVAHELRTPLTTVRGYLEGLADGILPPSKETFEMLRHEILRLVRLVEDLHSLTQAEAARATLAREKVSIAALVAEVVEWNRAEFEARRIAVENNIAAPLPDVIGDRDRLIQVLRNLTQNAWQHTPEDGFVRIEAEQAPGMLRVNFVSSGAALDGDEIRFWFELPT
jgi:signal transduction histidine kinase